MMKRLLAVIIFLSLILAVWVVPVCGDAFLVSVNGVTAKLSHAPIVHHDQVYIEIEELFRMVGGTTEWDKKGILVGSLGHDRLVFDPSHALFKTRGHIFYFKEPLLTLNEKIYVSLEEFAGPLGFTVQKYKSSVELWANSVFNAKYNSFPHYNIQAVYSHGKVYGNETVRLKNVRGSTMKDVLLVLPGPSVNPRSRIKILNVAVDGVQAEYQEGETYLKIVLPQPVEPSEDFTLEISFDTVVPKGPHRLGFTDQCAILSCWYPVVPLNESVPVYAEYGEPYSFQSGTYTVEMKVDSGMQVFSGLERIDGTENGGDSVCHFASSIPIREATFVVGDFHAKTRKVGNTDLYYAYQHYDPGILQYASNALKLFGKWWGEYPYPTLTLVEVPLEGYQGMEYGGIILFSSMNKPDTFIVVHEVAHQWWHGLVGNNPETEGWIDEGLANYSTLLYFENTVGAFDYSSRISSMRVQGGGGSQDLKRSLGAFRNRDEYKKTAYMRGAVFWHDVRERIGRERLMSLLSSIQEQYKHGYITTEEIFFQIEQASPGI